MIHKTSEPDEAGLRHDMTNEVTPIAIVGLAFEFAQDATSEEGFWHMISRGRSASTDFPKDRLNIDAFYHSDGTRTSTLPIRGGHFVEEDLGAFDAPFFSINPAEAACMDPQHRRMLETSYHALENAGVPLSKCCGSDTAVYTGCFTNDYINMLQHDFEAEQRHAAPGIGPSMLANRVSWFYDFKGPSMNLDSACSSSLIALHLACQDLRTKAASMALVGGANLVYHPELLKMFSNFGFLGADSRSWSFDERANGYARGEGTAVIVVKRLEDALRDGDTIRAVIRNTGSNQDGRTPGITQPSQEAQMKLIQRTYQQANLDMSPTRFFEAHGTGTPTGDPIEAAAIGMAFAPFRTVEDPLYVGAVKANIGHLEGASGLAGLIKAIFVLERGLIPPIAGLTNLNHRIDAEGLHLKFPTASIPWPTTGLRRACVNSFGFGGSNATAILDDAYHYLNLNNLDGFHQTRIESTDMDRYADDEGYRSPNDEHVPRLLVWSAADKAATLRLGDILSDFVGQRQDDKADLAYCLAARRSHLGWRSFTVIDGQYDIVSEKAKFEPAIPIKLGGDGTIAFVFTGQGSQYLGMGRGLSVFPAFMESLASQDECLRSIGCPWSVTDIIESGTKDLPIDRPQYSQPLTTCLQIALIDLLKDLGISPSTVMGHSSGEIAAAYASGALCRLSAIKVAYWRGILSSRVASESQNLGMMAVGLSRDGVQPYLRKIEEQYGRCNIFVGCVNSPKSVTLTGESSQLLALEDTLHEDSVFARKLLVPVAYHSPFMQIIAQDYQVAIGELSKGKRTKDTVMISSVTGSIATTHEVCTPQYWVRNLTSTVEFEDAFSTLLAMSNQTQRKQLGQKKKTPHKIQHVLEIGPHSTLQGPIRDCLAAYEGKDKPVYIPTLLRKSSQPEAFLKAVGTLHCYGHPVDLIAANNLYDEHRQIPRDMPPYPFNHENSYWKEGRLSRNHRFRKVARHDLLGTRSLDWNPHMAQWRNTIRLREMPWLEDHRVNGEPIFPAAGMIVMAIEALRQLLKEEMIETDGVQMRDVSFLRPITFSPDTGSTEVQLTLSITSSLEKREWTQFRLFKVEGDTYVECSAGFIRPVFANTDIQQVLNSATFLRNEYSRQWIDSVMQGCTKEAPAPYEVLSQSMSTLQYGPSFQNIQDMRFGDSNEALAHVNTHSWKSEALNLENQIFAVHPTTLDGLAQLVVLALSHGRQSRLPTMVPSHVGNIWIDTRTTSEVCISAVTKYKLRKGRGAIANIIATSTTSDAPLVYFDGLETAFIDSSEFLSDGKDPKARNLCTQLIWKPDVDLMTNTQIYEYCTRNRPTEPIEFIDEFEKVQVAIMAFIQEAIEFVIHHDIKIPEGHLQTYFDWMKHQQQRVINGDLQIDSTAVQQLLSDESSRQRLISEIEASGIEGNFFMQLGRNLIKILEGEMDALDLMFRNNLVDPYYETVLANEYIIHPLVQYVDLLSFKNPAMKILEIGAGTGGQTLRVLEAMSADGVKKWDRYDYTDVSPGFFTRVQTKFERYASLMNYQVLDISKDPIEQSFEAGSYDIILASQVLHATDSISQSLCNIRKLLKPNGKLIFGETTRPEALKINFAFGLLEGWLHPLTIETRSKFSPCLSSERWDQRLRETGFSGVDVEFLCQQYAECQYSSTLISSLAPTHVSGDMIEEIEVAILSNPSNQTQNATAGLLQKQFAGCSSFSLTELGQAQISSGTLVISLLEVEDSFLDSMSNTSYDLLKSILLTNRNTLWVTKSSSSHFSQPQHHLATGFGRTLASEDATRKFVTLTLDKLEGELEQVVATISAVSRKVIQSSIEVMETNYMATADSLEVCRVTAYAEMDEEIAQTNSAHQSQECRLGKGTRLALRVRESTAGSSTDLEFSNLALDVGLSLDNHEVRIEVKAFGFSHRDSLVLSGHLDTDADDGFITECAGVVTMAGTLSGFNSGDRVCLITTSAIGTHVQANAGAVALIPEGMSFIEAASVPTALWLSYHALVNLGRLQPGESVLIHRASSSFGQVAIQLARSIGADVLVTATSADKRKRLIEQYDLTANTVFDYSDASLLNKIAKVTEGQGVDVVIGSVGLDPEVAFTKCLAPFGRLIDIGLYPKPRTSNEDRPVENIMQAKVDMAELFRKRPAMAFKIFQQATKTGLGKHILPSESIQVFQASEVRQAVEHLRSPSKDGKRIIELSPGTTVLATVKTKPTYSFPADATYVIAGGLGGLGRSIAQWLAKRGARNLALLSRSGPRTKEAKDLVADLESQGVRCVTPLTDISNLVDLKKTLVQLSEQGMPPIKGCVQATVALRDNVFENMSYEDWSVSTSSKVTGSWNLHQAMLPSDLDFFVLISSIGGIYGSRGQANYAAGNTFKDAVARHRVEKGLKAVSIDLGVMIETGVVAESDFLLGFMRRIGFLMDIVTDEFLALMDHYCNPGLALLEPNESQIVVGLELPANMLSRGLDLHHAIHRPMTSHLFRMGLDEQETSRSAGAAAVDRAAQLSQTSSEAEAVELVTKWLLWKLGLMLGLPEFDIDVHKPIYAYGIDSLVAIDLKNWLLKEIGAEITVFELLGNQPLTGLCEMAVERSRYRKKA